MIVISGRWRRGDWHGPLIHEDPRLYLRIAADLRKRIEAGELEAGQPAPSITSLCQEWDVARETAAHAMRTLEAEGLVRRYPGRGYYVIGR